MNDSSVILYKQVSIGNDTDLNFRHEAFWIVNKEEYTFAMQNFDALQYDDIITKVKKMKFEGNYAPKYHPSINYAFVSYKRSNDTVYYDGYENWWILTKGKYSMYKDEKKELSDNLRKFYPIFRNCSYSPQDD